MLRIQGTVMGAEEAGCSQWPAPHDAACRGGARSYGRWVPTRRLAPEQSAIGSMASISESHELVRVARGGRRT
jgi:hypothetical protein